MPLARSLSTDLTLYKGALFPYKSRRTPRLRHTVCLGVGGNVGDVRRRFVHLIVALWRRRGIHVHKSAPILKNPPFGFREQDDFYNTVIELSTPMQPRAFLRYLWRLERRFGRVRSFANAPRTLDLDILFFDHRTVNRAELQIPHPHWHERQSVVIPLAYLGGSR